MSVKRLVASVGGDTPANVYALDYAEADSMYVLKGMTSVTHPGWMGRNQEELSFVFATDAVDDNDDRDGAPAEAFLEAMYDRYGAADLGGLIGAWLAAKVDATDITQSDADDLADALATAIGGTYTPA